jgi:sarcosine oxidase
MATTVERCDSLVVGGGVMGAAAAWALARHGEKVTLLDRFEPGHTHGSSHGDGRIFRFTYPEPVYLKMAQLAHRGWRDLSRYAGRPLVIATGNWDTGRPEQTQIVELERNLRDHDIPFEQLSAAESNLRFPQLHVPDGSVALYQPDGGVVLADPAVAALWAAARRSGASCAEGERVHAIEPHDGGVRVATESGRRFAAQRLVLAAGAWSRDLLAPLGLDLPLSVSREMVVYLPPRDPQGPVDHRIGKMPTFIDYHRCQEGDDEPCPVYGLPQIEVPGVKLGLHHWGRPLAAPDDDGQPGEALEQATIEVARQLLPHLSDQPVATVTCLYTNTPDYHFVLDRMPGERTVTVGAGFSGHGFKFGPAIGDILAALALGDAPPVPLELFTIARLTAGGELEPRTGV